MSLVRKLAPGDHSEAVEPWIIRARQYSRVVGWRSSSTVKLVVSVHVSNCRTGTSCVKRGVHGRRRAMVARGPGHNAECTAST
jgi:hypothetical protein